MPASPEGFTLVSWRTAMLLSWSLMSSPLKTILAFSRLSSGVSQCFTLRIVINQSPYMNRCFTIQQVFPWNHLIIIPSPIFKDTTCFFSYGFLPSLDVYANLYDPATSERLHGRTVHLSGWVHAWNLNLSDQAWRWLAGEEPVGLHHWPGENCIWIKTTLTDGLRHRFWVKGCFWRFIAFGMIMMESSRYEFTRVGRHPCFSIRKWRVLS